MNRVAEREMHILYGEGGTGVRRVLFSFVKSRSSEVGSQHGCLGLDAGSVGRIQPERARACGHGSADVPGWVCRDRPLCLVSGLRK